uniref:Uncharacterized protein n=1 Tax=Arundo donax TaxID=35708 RepID=A0A0A9ETC2_ARUDO
MWAQCSGMFSEVESLNAMLFIYMIYNITLI